MCVRYFTGQRFIRQDVWRSETCIRVDEKSSFLGGETDMKGIQKRELKAWKANISRWNRQQWQDTAQKRTKIKTAVRRVKAIGKEELTEEKTSYFFHHLTRYVYKLLSWWIYCVCGCRSGVSAATRPSLFLNVKKRIRKIKTDLKTTITHPNSKRQS